MANVGMPTPLMPRGEGASATGIEPASYIISHEAMMHWLATTDAELIFMGAAPNFPLLPRNAQDTTVTYCSNRSGSTCSGPCSVYSGGPMCLSAPDTNCLSATSNVAFCSSPGCAGACTTLDNCIEQLDDGFCYTPSTQSIAVLSS